MPICTEYPTYLYKKHAIRRYGFHGTSHRYVSSRVCDLLGREMSTQKIVTCHLGNGASIAAVKNGRSVDTSMGFTPIEGLIMGTRAGDLDIGVVTFIMEKEELGLAFSQFAVQQTQRYARIDGGFFRHARD